MSFPIYFILSNKIYNITTNILFDKTKYIEKDPSITLAICSQNLKEKNYDNALENAYSMDIVLYQYFEFISILIFFSTSQ